MGSQGVPQCPQINLERTPLHYSPLSWTWSHYAHVFSRYFKRLFPSTSAFVSLSPPPPRLLRQTWTFHLLITSCLPRRTSFSSTVRFRSDWASPPLFRPTSPIPVSAEVICVTTATHLRFTLQQSRSAQMPPFSLMVFLPEVFVYPLNCSCPLELLRAHTTPL